MDPRDVRERADRGVGFRPTELSSPALQTRPPLRVWWSEPSFPMRPISKRRTKNKPAYAHESNRQRLKRLLREMGWNDWSVPLNSLIDGGETTPAHRRIIELSFCVGYGAKEWRRFSRAIKWQGWSEHSKIGRSTLCPIRGAFYGSGASAQS